MDVLSTYSVLQYHREALFMPYFTLQEFVAALSLKTPADRFLMTYICHQILHKLNNKPQSFSNSCNIALSYYNNATSRAKQLPYMQKYQIFIELSTSAKLEVLNQLIISALNQSFTRYDGDGNYYDELKDDTESFIPLGVDVECNEYYLLYPDILVVFSLQDRLPFKCLERYEPVDLDSLQMSYTQYQSACTHLFNDYLEKNNVMQQTYDNDGKEVNPEDLERMFDFYSSEQKERMKFYGFDGQSVKEGEVVGGGDMESFKTGSFDMGDARYSRAFEQFEFGVDQIVNWLQFDKYAEISGKIASPDHMFKRVDKRRQEDEYLDQDYEESSESEKPPKLSAQEIKLLCQELARQKQQFSLDGGREPVDAHLNSKSIYVQQREITLQLYNSTSILQFFTPFSRNGISKEDKIYTHVIRMNRDKGLTQDLLDEIQFRAIRFIRQVLAGAQSITVNGKTVKITSKNYHTYKDILLMQIDHVYSILHSMVATLYQYQQHQLKQLDQFRIENIQLYNELSQIKNNYLINFEYIEDTGCSVVFKRQKIQNIGDLAALQQVPIYLRCKASFPKTDELEQLKVDLGYEQPVFQYVKQPESNTSSYEYESSSSSEERKRRRRAYDFSDDEYMSNYYSMITSDEAPTSVSTASVQESSSESIYRQHVIRRRDFDFDRMEAIDVNGNVILQPRRRDDEGRILSKIFDIRGDDESDLEREMLVREWKTPELLQKEQKKRERVAKRAETRQRRLQQQGKHKKRHRRESFRHNTIIITAKNASQFQQFNSMMEQQMQKTEALKRLAIQQMSGRTDGQPRVEIPKMRIITNQPAAKGQLPRPQAVLQQSAAQQAYNSLNNKAVAFAPQQVAVQQPAFPQPTSGGQPVLYEYQPKPKVELSMTSIKNKLRQDQKNDQLDGTVAKINELVQQKINEQEQKGQRGRIPVSFYNEIKQIIFTHGMSIDEYMK